MKVVIFDLLGKFAHFRKYYTNSSSLSYYFPPRTTINGLIAGIIGLKRDSYYTLFSKDKSFVGLCIKCKLRKITQVVNYIKAKEPKELNLSRGEHTQIPIEIVLPEDLKDFIRYRIFFYHKEEEILNKVYERIKNNSFVYPPYFGISEFIANIEFIDFIEPRIEKTKFTEISSVVNFDYLNIFDGELISEPEKIYIKERMPYDFNENRIMSEEPKDFLMELNKGLIKISTKIDLEIFTTKEDKFIFM